MNSSRIKAYFRKKAKAIRWALMKNGLYPTGDLETLLFDSNSLEDVEKKVRKQTQAVKQSIIKDLDSLTYEDLDAVLRLVDLLAEHPATRGEKGSLYLWAAGDARAALLEARATEARNQVPEAVTVAEPVAMAA